MPSTSLPSSEIKILLLENIHAVAAEQLRAEGFVVETAKSALSEAELVQRIAEFDVLGIRSKTRITPRVLEAAPRLLTVGAFCIGTNQIALAEANRRGVPAFNAPFSNTRSVAELIIAEVVMLSRHLGDRSREVHAGQWRKVSAGSHEVRGRTLGIVGYGHIGSQVGVLAEGFGMRVVYHDIATKLTMGNNRALPTLGALLEQADFVTLHVPATPQTHEMMGAAEIAKKKGEAQRAPALLVVRSQLFSLALFPLLVLLLRGEARAPSRRIWLLVPLVALWSNLHGGVLLAPADRHGGLVAQGDVLAVAPVHLARVGRHVDDEQHQHRPDRGLHPVARRGEADAPGQHRHDQDREAGEQVEGGDVERARGDPGHQEAKQRAIGDAEGGGDHDGAGGPRQSVREEGEPERANPRARGDAGVVAGVGGGEIGHESPRTVRAGGRSPRIEATISSTRRVGPTSCTRNIRAPSAAASAVAASVPSRRSVSSTPKVSPTKSLLLSAIRTGHPVLTRSFTWRNKVRPW